jgi:hypothetical protein
MKDLNQEDLEAGNYKYGGKKTCAKKTTKQINKVSERECLDALEYFWQTMDLDGNTDKELYMKILLKKVANDLKIKLGGI